ncbi:MFS transporter, partial [Streptomyces sp. NPDC050121]
ASQLTNGAHRMAEAVGSSFADAVAHTSLVGAAILELGAVSVAFLLPGKGRGAKARAEDPTKAEEAIKTSATLEKEPEIARTSS